MWHFMLYSFCHISFLKTHLVSISGPWTLCLTRVAGTQSMKGIHTGWSINIQKKYHSHFLIAKITADDLFLYLSIPSPSVVKALSPPSSSVLISVLTHLYDPYNDLFSGLRLIIGLVLRLLTTTVSVDHKRGA